MPKIKVSEIQPPTVGANGGGFDGASRTSRELATWSPIVRSADQEINHDKVQLNARARDMVRNEGYTLGAVNMHKDSIVGGQYTLNAQPLFKLLGADDVWAEEFQEVVESKFSLLAESPDNWLDASRINTFTGLIRLITGIHTVSGEAVGTAEWLRSSAQRRPFNTAIQLIDVDRLSNPMDGSDTLYLRGGVERDKYGAPVAYHFRTQHPAEGYAEAEWGWTRVAARKPWGRLQVLHIYEQNRPDQSRGVSDMVAVLKEMRMTKKFRDITLQNAVLQATYAASIESDLPADAIWEQMGIGSTDGTAGALNTYLNQLAEYAGGAKGLNIDGTKIPHLFPGTKLKLQPAGTPGGMGTGFEESLQRHIAAALGLSYEEFSRDFSKTNYSSARASMLVTWKSMQSKKKTVADRAANAIYALVLEEMINANEVPLPAGKKASHFYEGLNKEAYCNCEWIGAARGQIDEFKETQAAVLRINNNLSTAEDEIAKGGKDFRRVYAQRAREQRLAKELKLETVATTNAAPGQKSNGQTDDDNDSNDKKERASAVYDDGL